MRKYLVEFEFKTNIGNYYWFPIFLEAENSSFAEITAKTIQSAIEQHYTLIRRTQVQQIIEGVNAEPISEYIKHRRQGRIVILEMNVWQFKNLPTIPELNFDEHLQLLEYTQALKEGNIADVVFNQQFPVRLYYSNPDFQENEFLLLNVVDPLNVDELYILVELSNADFLKTGLQLIQEGYWKDAHISGYKIRVDAPHTADGKRHVHIAHTKHVNSKNKQVSWNEDKTRHDKKSFDENFNGLERAKEIAKIELGLEDGALFENLQLKGNLLLEDVRYSFDDNEFYCLYLNKQESF